MNPSSTRTATEAVSDDQALKAVANYLRDCGVEHPDDVCERSHHFVNLAKQRCTSGKQSGNEHADPFRLSRLSLEAVLEAMETAPKREQFTAGRDVIPSVSLRSIETNATPALLGPLRLTWWSAQIVYAIAAFSRSVSVLRLRRSQTPMSDVQSDAQ